MEKGADSDNRQANEYVNTHHQCYFPTVSELFEAVQNTLNVIQDDSDTVVSKAYLNGSYLYTTAVYNVVVDKGNVIIKTIQIDPEEELEGIAILPDGDACHWSAYVQLFSSISLMSIKEFANALNEVGEHLENSIVMIEALIDLSMDDNENDLPPAAVLLKGVCGKLQSSEEIKDKYMNFGGCAFKLRCYSALETLTDALASGYVTRGKAERAESALKKFLSD